jgi:citrate-Mg2+:H+ or citrate-Ca2+:H+ symporter, CitMHS family
MITIIGFAMMLGVIALILLRKLSPVVAFATIPVATSLLAGFSTAETGAFIGDGLKTVAPTATLFVFAILYFGIMRDRGLFDPFVRFLVAKTHGQPLAVAIVTVIVAAVAHLGGFGAATFMLTIPALLPLYRRLQMSPLMLLCLVGVSAGVMNMLPWSAPTARAAAATSTDAVALWHPLIPVQGLGVVSMLVVACILGLRAQRCYTAVRGAGLGAEPAAAEPVRQHDLKREHALAISDWRYWANFALTVAILAVLLTDIFLLYGCFMVGLGLALLLNYPHAGAQVQRIAAHANDALQMALVVLAAGVLLGILAGSEMSSGMAHALIDVLPASSASMLHLILGAFGVPLGMLLSPDAYYFAFLPIVRDVATAAGVPVESVARAMLIGGNISCVVSPVVPSVYLAVGLAGVELHSHIRYTFVWVWGVSLVLLAFAVAIGVVTV